MNRRLSGMIALVALATVVLMASVVLLYPIASPISTKDSHIGVLLGILFWLGMTLVASSLAVRMPGGSVVDVAFAPIVAGMSLGGPVVAGLTALIGTTQARELRREVPWYGVVANHCGIAAPAIVGAMIFQAAPWRGVPAADFLATVIAAAIAFSLNALIDRK